MISSMIGKGLYSTHQCDLPSLHHLTVSQISYDLLLISSSLAPSLVSVSSLLPHRRSVALASPRLVPSFFVYAWVNPVLLIIRT